MQVCDGSVMRVCVSGTCREGERLVVGPTDQGRFLRLKVGSIQRNRSACRVLRAGQAATLALGTFDRSLLRKVRGHGGQSHFSAPLLNLRKKNTFSYLGRGFG